MAEKYAGVGHVVQVIGPVMDIQFEAGHLPAIYNAVRITSEGFSAKIEDISASTLIPNSDRLIIEESR